MREGRKGAKDAGKFLDDELLARFEYTISVQQIGGTFTRLTQSSAGRGRDWAAVESLSVPEVTWMSSGLAIVRNGCLKS